jgi:hypothetical protein
MNKIDKRIADISLVLEVDWKVEEIIFALVSLIDL